MAAKAQSPCLFDHKCLIKEMCVILQLTMNNYHVQHLVLAR